MTTKYSIGEFGKKTGLTIRTLHYYDELGILKPTLVTDKGRRYYSEQDFITLQKIVTLKFLGYSLDQIKEFLETKTWDIKDSLKLQKETMLEQKKQIENVLKALDHALNVMEHHGTVDPSLFITLINGIQMESEHKEFLKTILDEQKVEHIYSTPDDRQREIEKETIGIMAELNKLYGQDVESKIVQCQIEKLIDLMSEVAGGDLSFLEEVANVEIENEDWIFPSPFTKEVEEWVLKGIEINLVKRGINLHERTN
ncbi:MerR family transcriptional regulator [Bacillaceae bacterium CLA-AA-H227]|uniref:MerR family transcriptional regulator n=1 Tax=Robertmurraya yapensis (ex Hitch et al 2024) TaxID=3133160 RepID=A0ACC6SFC4_9BACI